MFNRYLKFTKKNIRRSPFQAIIACMVMFLTFLTLDIFLLLAYGSQTTLKYFESKPQVIAFFKDGTTDKDITAIQGALKQDIRVAETRFITKEEALKKYQKDNKNDPLLLELVTADILPPSIEVSTKSPDDLSAIADILTREPVVEQVFIPKDVIQNLTSFTSIIRWVGGITTGFMMAFSTLIILMIIGFKIRLKKTEIETMRLLGASTNFIRMPFLFEGIFYGIFGSMTSWIFTYSLVWYFTPFLQGYLKDIQLLPINPFIMLTVLGIGTIVAFLIGGIGSFIATRRYLRT